MATESEFIADLKLRSQAFGGIDDGNIESFVSSALAQLGQYQPRILTSQRNEVNETGIYDVPDGYVDILRVYDPDDNLNINFVVIIDAEDDAEKLHLRRKQRPSWNELNFQEYYDTPESLSYIRLNSDGYGSFNIEYSVPLTVVGLNVRWIDNAKLYAEYMAYDYKASNIENFVDITDQDPSSGSTTISYSQQEKSFTSKADMKLKQFKERMERPYGTRSMVEPEETSPYVSTRSYRG